MPTCKRMTEMATDRAEGHLGLLDRLAFDRHLARCDGCGAFVRQLEATRQALSRLPEPEISSGLNQALLAGFDAWVEARPAAPAPRAAWRFSPWPPLGAAAALVALLAFARHRSAAPDDWLVASALAAVALLLAVLAGRFAVGVALAAVAAAVAAALAGGTAGALDAATGAECLALELGAAAAAGGVAWLGARRGASGAVRRVVAGGAVAGALAADAALQITCRAREALPHALAFHAGGVLLVALAAAALVAVRAADART
ncbi:MAG TPA: hypothetical protein VFF02_07615 [Anaeromyxobacteraceae bacterium]|nr:hypothetical protein [Anaeromyxobacteraceae bacterium]